MTYWFIHVRYFLALPQCSAPFGWLRPSCRSYNFLGVVCFTALYYYEVRDNASNSRTCILLYQVGIIWLRCLLSVNNDVHLCLCQSSLHTKPFFYSMPVQRKCWWFSLPSIIFYLLVSLKIRSFENSSIKLKLVII